MAILLESGLRTPHPAPAVEPRLAPGTELLGEFQDSAYQTPKYLVQRADGQVMQLPHLLYRVAGSLDGRDAGQIAAELSAEFEQEVTAEQVSFLVDERLRPVGIIDAEDPAALADGAPPVKSDPLLGLRYRIGLIPASVSWHLGGLLRPFFARPVWIAAVAAFVVVHGWIVARASLLDQALAGVDQMVRAPLLLLLVYVVQAASASWHECGHVTACRYGGARPGDMGMGLYIVWPAFYSTVTDSYRLDRTGRLRTDLGGIYFDAIFMTGVGAVYLYTGQPWLLVMLLGMLFETAWQLLPSIRLDGYYILADLVGVPDLFGYIQPALTSLLPGRPTHPKLHELRPRARRVIIAWVALAVPTLLVFLVLFLIALPHVLPVVWDALLWHLDTLDVDVRAGDAVDTTVGVVELLLLVLPWVGVVLVWGMLWGSLRRAAAAKWGWAWAQPESWVTVRRFAAATTVAGLAAALVWRVASVAASAPASAAEARISASAFGGLELGRAAAPDVAPAELAVREQLMAYARLTGAFGRHADVLTGAREPAVLACVVLVVCYLVAARILHWRWWTIALPLAAVAAMGPAVVQLASLGPGVVGAAWTAAGGTLLLAARRRRGRHRRRSAARHRATTWLAAAAVAVGVVTAPFLAAPLAVGAAVLVLRSGGRPAWLSLWTPRVRGALALTALVAVSVPALLRAPTTTAISAAEWQVLLLVACLVVAGGLLQAGLVAVSLPVASLLGLALVPTPGADAVLPPVVCATVFLGGLVAHHLTREPAEARPHPLLRAVVAVPVLMLVVVGALFVPPSAPALPHAQAAGLLTDPVYPAATVTAPRHLWADLMRDGVPADRLRPTGAGGLEQAGWEVVVGDPGPLQRERVVFGSGDAALTVFWSG